MGIVTRKQRKTLATKPPAITSTAVKSSTTRELILSSKDAPAKLKKWASRIRRSLILPRSEKFIHLTDACPAAPPHQQTVIFEKLDDGKLRITLRKCSHGNEWYKTWHRNKARLYKARRQTLRVRVLEEELEETEERLGRACEEDRIRIECEAETMNILKRRFECTMARQMVQSLWEHDDVFEITLDPSLSDWEGISSDGKRVVFSSDDTMRRIIRNKNKLAFPLMTVGEITQFSPFIGIHVSQFGIAAPTPAFHGSAKDVCVASDRRYLMRNLRETEGVWSLAPPARWTFDRFPSSTDQFDCFIEA